MEREALKGKINEVLERSQMVSLATIKDGKPWARYMMLHYKGNFELYTTTFVNSRKVEQIKKDNHVHVTAGGDPNNLMAAYVNIEATAEVRTDAETKEKCWEKMMEPYYSGPDDPNYAVIKLSPQTIEYMNPETHIPEIYEV